MDIIDCRSETGITIGLIDSLISISRIVAKRNLEEYNIIEALKDFQADEDIKFLINFKT